jgi:membrane-associated phospholipid phosphatase
VYALFPVAPPRLAGIGMVDTVSSQTGFAMDSSLTTKFYNELAAVPSLHVGFAVAIGIAIAAAVRNPLAKVLWLLWGPAIGLAVMATGNHFVFDIVAGVVAAVMGFVLGTVTWRSLPALRDRLERRRARRPRTVGPLRPAFAEGPAVGHHAHAAARAA